MHCLKTQSYNKFQETSNKIVTCRLLFIFCTHKNTGEKIWIIFPPQPRAVTHTLRSLFVLSSIHAMYSYNLFCHNHWRKCQSCNIFTAMGSSKAHSYSSFVVINILAYCLRSMFRIFLQFS